METLFTSSSFLPEFIFSNLKGEIVDYIISSYMVDMSIVHVYYWHPNIQVHCDTIYNNSILDSQYITLHQVQKPGIYHAKFVLVTTTKVLRLIIMTTNFTNQLISENWNDYYILTIPKTKKKCVSKNMSKFMLFLNKSDIHLKQDIFFYDWSSINANIICSIPNVVSHYDCYKECFEKEQFDDCTVQCSTMIIPFNWSNVFNVKNVTIVIPDDFDKRKDKDMNYFILNISNPYNFTIKSEHYDQPYHFKRYILNNQVSSYMIITSANLTKQAWGCNLFMSLNAELGIIWKKTK